MYGSTLPLDANTGTGLEKIGFTLRQPCGVIVAISPFNFPALTVLHKIAPALAAGNAVVLKPARSTPLTALKLAQCFVDAGLPAGALSVLTGPGGKLGDRLVTDPRVRKVTFTGSTATGAHIAAVAGIKKLSLELGAACPVIVLPDADIEVASSAVAAGGYVNAGQVCISVQRVIVDERVEADFLDALVPKVEAIAMGDPAEDATRLGSLISEAEAIRVASAIRTAGESGAKVLTGGDRDGAVVSPAVVAAVDPRSPFSQDELFGPGVAVSSGAGHGCGDRDRQRYRVWLGGRHFHRGCGGCGAGDAADRCGQHSYQLDAVVAGGFDALWRVEGQRYRQGGCAFGCA